MASISVDHFRLVQITSESGDGAFFVHRSGSLLFGVAVNSQHITRYKVFRQGPTNDYDTAGSEWRSYRKICAALNICLMSAEADLPVLTADHIENTTYLLTVSSS